MPDVASLSVSINADTKGLEAGIQRANQQVSGLGSQLQGAASLVTTAFAGIAAGAAAGVGAAVKSAADFEKQISAIAAVSGEGAEGMEKIRQTALQLGKDTSFSAQEAAAGMEEIIKAGLSVEQVVGGAGRAVLDLSAASGTAVEESARIMSNALNIFKADNMTAAEAANILAGAANASATSVHELGYGLASVGSIAAQVGLTFEDTAAMLAVMAQNGIKSADAGTSIKAMLNNLVPSTDKASALFNQLGLNTFNTANAMELLRSRGLQPVSEEAGALAHQIATQIVGIKDWATATDKQRKAYDDLTKQSGVLKNAFFDETGAIKSAAEIADILREKFGDLTQEQQILYLQTLFGTDGQRAASILMREGATAVTQMTEAMRKQGDVQRIANERLDNVLGSWEKLKGSLETGAIMLGSIFLPSIKQALDGVTGFVNQVIEAFEQIPDAVATVKQVFAGEWAPDSSIRPFTLAVGEAAIMVRDTFGPAITTVGGFLQQLATWFTENLAPIAAFVAGFSGAIVTLGLVTAAVTAVTAVLGFLLSPIGLIALAVGALAAAWQTNFMNIQGHTAALWAYLQPVLTQLIDWIGPRIQTVLTWLSETGWPMLVTAAQRVGEWITTTGIPALTQLVEWLGPKLTAVMTWITETGWPTLVTAAEKVSEWITGTAIPTLTELVDWLGPKIRPVLEWITTEGWPGLQKAMTEAERIGRLVIKVFQDFYVELERRGLIDLAKKAFDDLLTVLKPIYDTLKLIVGVAAGVLGFIADLGLKGAESGNGVKFLAEQIDKFFRPIASGLQSLRDLIELIKSLGDLKPPEWFTRWIGGGGGGGGGGGAQTLSYGSANVAQGEIADYIRASAIRHGIDPETAIRVAMSEGGVSDPVRQSDVITNGVREPSFGPFQLYMGGGLGNAALAQGIDPRNPAHWRQAVDFALAQAARGGWGPWHGAARVGIGNWQGIGAARPPAAPAASPPLSGMQRVPLSGEPGATPDQWPGFMEQTFEQLPTFLQSLDTIQQAGTEAFANVGTVGIEQAATLATGASQQYDLLSTAAVNSVNQLAEGTATTLMDSAGNTITTVTGMSGEVINQYGTLANGASVSLADLATSSTTSVNEMTGEITRTVTDGMGNVITTVTTAGGQVVGQWVTTAGQMAATNATMVADTTTSNAALAANVAATGTQLVSEVTNAAGVTVERYREMNGEIVTIVTDQNGKVLADFTLTAQQIGLETDTMHTQLIATTTDALGQTVEVYREATGEIVTLVIDQNGKVVSETVDATQRTVSAWTTTTPQVIAAVTEMGNQVIGQSRVMGEGLVTHTKNAMGEIVTVVTDGAGKVVKSFGTIVEGGKTMATGLDITRAALKKLKGELDSVEKAANEAASAIARVGSKGGYKGGGSGSGNIFGKASGGPVWSGETYMVGEAGPELFVPSSSGMIVPNHLLGGGGAPETLRVEIAVKGRVAREIVIEGYRLAVRSGWTPTGLSG